MALYKYAPLKGEHKYDLLIQGKICFSNPDDFNDPLDSKLEYRQEYSDQEITDYWNDYISRGREELRGLHTQFLESPSFVNQQNRVAKTFRKGVGVSCFSVDEKNILMWSHYANNHKGIVYEFKPDLLKDSVSDGFNDNPFRVDYAEHNQYELLSYALTGKPKKDQFVRELLTKAKDWEYEQEYRFIDLNFENGHGRSKPFNKTSLRSIIFGAKTPEEEKNKIKRLCQQHGFKHVQFMQAKFKPGSFELDIKKDMKIIHIFHDDKFPKMAYRVFESVYPGKNEFVIFTNKKNLEHNKDINSVIYKRYLILFPLVIKILIKADVVVFHSMSNDNLKILSALSPDVKTIWIGWGYDYYDLLPNNLLKETTASLSQSSSSSMKKKFTKQVKEIIKKIVYAKLDKKKLINKVNVFSPVLYEDYKLVKNHLSGFSPEYGAWNYGTLEDDHIRGFENKYINGSNILLGNSSSETNNHLDAFELLQRLDLKDKKLIVPLSYGDANYRNLIVKEGKAIFGSVLEPLTDLMPIDEYISILQSCSVVVMNHLRQQALGNIVIALYMGAKVFLDERNPVYEFFAEQNAYIFKLQQLEQEYSSILTSEQIAHNRQILKEYWSRDVILEKTEKLVEQALKA